MNINDKTVAQLFQQYEKTRFDFYKNFRVKGFFAWQVIKRPLYYDITSDVFYQNAKRRRGSSMKKYLVAFLKFPFQFFRIKTKKKKIKALVIGHEIYRFEKDENGKDINNFADHWYHFWENDERIFFEYRSGIKDPEMSNLREDLDINFLNAIVAVVVTLASKMRWRNKTVKDLSTNLQSFLASNIDEVPNLVPIVRRIVLRFQIEYGFYSFLFRTLKPQFLIVTDEIGTGVMAAANKAGVIVVENQHGHFDKLKPDYMLDPQTLGTSREKLILPNYITVFGEYFKKSLISDSIWKNEEIVPVGNVRIDKYRQKRKSSAEHEFTILIPTQWNVFTETMTLLNELSDGHGLTKVRILVKMHPREPKSHIDEYHKLAQADSIFSILDSQCNIYDLFLQSDVVVGFDSTSLFEAVACGLPTITINTAIAPDGIHSYIIKEEVLMNAIKISDAKGSWQIISNWLANKDFRSDWLKKVREAGNYLYTENCIENCRSLIANKITWNDWHLTNHVLQDSQPIL